MGQRIPQEQAAQEQAPQEGGGGAELGDLLGNLSQGMAMLTEVVSEAGINPAIAERLQGIQSEFDSVVQEIAGGGGEQAPQGQVPAEAGVNGVPQTPQMR